MQDHIPHQKNSPLQQKSPLLKRFVKNHAFNSVTSHYVSISNTCIISALQTEGECTASILDSMRKLMSLLSTKANLFYQYPKIKSWTWKWPLHVSFITWLRLFRKGLSLKNTFLQENCCTVTAVKQDVQLRLACWWFTTIRLWKIC